MKIFEKVIQLKKELDILRPIAKEEEDRIMQKFRLAWNYHSKYKEKIETKIEAVKKRKK